MLAVLLIVCVLAFAMIAPIKVVLIGAAGFAFASLVVQAATSAIAGVKVEVAQAFKAILLSLFFTLVASFTLMSAQRGAPGFGLGHLANSSAGVFQFSASVLAFRIGLGLTWLHAAIVAAASSAIIASSVWLMCQLLS